MSAIPEKKALHERFTPSVIEFFGDIFDPRYAYRTPDMWEQVVDWKHRVYDVSTSDFGIDDPVFYIRAMSPGGLAAVEIVSHEIAYRGVLLEQSLVLDIKLFKNELYQLLSQQLELTSFEPRNDGEVSLKGLEIEARYSPSQRSKIYFWLSYLDSETESEIEKTLYSQYSSFIGMSTVFNERLTLSSMLSVATNDSDRDLKRGFMRVDFTGIYRPEFSTFVKGEILARLSVISHFFNG